MSVDIKIKIVKSVPKVVCVSDNLIFLKVSAHPVDILVFQVYMPTSDHKDKEVETIRNEIEQILQEKGKGRVNTIIMGDWNSVMETVREGKLMIQHKLGKRDDGRKVVVDICPKNGLITMNTWFKKRPKSIQVDDSRRDHKISNRLHLGETTLQGQCQACDNDAWS